MTPDRFIALLLAFLFTLATAWAVSAQPYPAGTPFSTDRLEMQDGEIRNTAVVIYENSGSMTSEAGRHELTAPNGIVVACFIEINATDTAERITCIAPDGFMAYPVEADVMDGDEVTILIAPPLM